MPPTEPQAVAGSSPVIPSDPKAYRKFVRELEARAAHVEETGRKLLDRHGTRLADPTRRELEAQWAALHQARTAEKRAGSTQTLLDALETFDANLDEHMGRWRKSTTREYVEAIVWAVLLTLVIRAFVFEAFKIPTGSMIPTLQIHDHLFVNKFIYGLKIPFTRIKFLAWRQPQPGEVIVFEYPYDDDPSSSGKDLIKRVIGVPGDRLKVVDDVIWRNGKPVPHKVETESGDCGQEGMLGSKCVKWKECVNGFEFTTQHLAEGGRPDWPSAIPNHEFPHADIYSPPLNKDFPEFVVPPGHLLVMGDNRDNSQDGRFFGLVPMDTVKGKAGILWFATDWHRIGHFVHERAPGGTCEGF